MADYIRKQLQAKGIRVVTGAGLTEILGSDKATGIRTSVGNFDGEAVVLESSWDEETKTLLVSYQSVSKEVCVTGKWA